MQHFVMPINTLDFQNKGGYTHEQIGGLGTSSCIFVRVKRKVEKFRMLVGLSIKIPVFPPRLKI